MIAAHEIRLWCRLQLMIIAGFLSVHYTNAIADPLIIHPTLAPPYNQIPGVILEGVREVFPSARLVNVEDVNEIPSGSIVLTEELLEKNELFGADTLHSVAGLVLDQKRTTIYSVDLQIDPQVIVRESRRFQPDANSFVFFDIENRMELLVENLDIRRNRTIKIMYRSVASAVDALKAVAEASGSANRRTVFVFMPGFIELAPEILLKAILDSSWDRQVVTVGGRIGYVRAGLTLGVLADFKGYGNQLARLLETAIGERFNEPKQTMLVSVKTAVNVRTAQNSGIQINSDTSEWDYSFPEE